jgi:formylglycine-generating enzyme required for sulfatase activity
MNAPRIHLRILTALLAVGCAGGFVLGGDYPTGRHPAGESLAGDTNSPARGKRAPDGMVVIRDGVFKPQFRSTADPKEIPVKAFCLDVLPVTNEDFLEFVQANPRWQGSQVKRLFADEFYLTNWASDLELGTNAPPNAPVTYVSWFAAKAYAQWRGKRLPTVAEWELVAAANATRPNADDDPQFQQVLLKWYATPAGQRLASVGAGTTNYWGVHDLHGLIWEWVADFNTALVTGDARGDTGLDRKLFCGSGAVGAADVRDYAAFMRYGFRSSLKADYCVQNLGFRCAKDL